MRNFRRALCTAAALALSFAACSGDEDGGGSTDVSDAAVEDGASAFDGGEVEGDSGPGPVDPPPCNSIANDAPAVQATVVGTAMPAGEGGTIQPGTYFATSVVYHRLGSDANDLDESWKQTYAVTATTFELAWEGPDAERVTGTATYTTAGDEITIAQGCPEEGETVATYTATATELTFFDDNEKRVITLTKQ